MEPVPLYRGMRKLADANGESMGILQSSINFWIIAVPSATRELSGSATIESSPGFDKLIRGYTAFTNCLDLLFGSVIRSVSKPSTILK